MGKRVVGGDEKEGLWGGTGSPELNAGMISSGRGAAEPACVSYCLSTCVFVLLFFLLDCHVTFG